jgi:hypothetical protein
MRESQIVEEEEAGTDLSPRPTMSKSAQFNLE